MTSWKRSGNAGLEKDGVSLPEISGRSEAATGGLPTRARAENAGVARMNPNGRVGGAEYGTSCIGEPQRVSSVQISEKPLRNVPASVRGEADRSQSSKLDADSAPCNRGTSVPQPSSRRTAPPFFRGIGVGSE